LHRRAITGVAFTAAVLVLAVAVVASRSSPSSRQQDPLTATQRSGAECLPTAVEYGQIPKSRRQVASGLIPSNLPWVRDESSRIFGLLFYLSNPEFTRRYRLDRRPARAVISTGGEVRPGMQTKILWWVRDRSGDRPLILAGKRLDGGDELRQALGGGPVIPSIVTIPTAGCWKLTLSNGTISGTLVFEALTAG
jgi:hypothetical protein